MEERNFIKDKIDNSKMKVQDFAKTKSKELSNSIKSANPLKNQTITNFKNKASSLKDTTKSTYNNLKDYKNSDASSRKQMRSNLMNKGKAGAKNKLSDLKNNTLLSAKNKAKGSKVGQKSLKFINFIAQNPLLIKIILIVFAVILALYLIVPTIIGMVQAYGRTDHYYCSAGSKEDSARYEQYCYLDNGSSGTADNLLEAAKKIAEDDNIGYSQDRRYKNPDVDCSSFVWYALDSVESLKITEGMYHDCPFTTKSMGECLVQNGWSEHDFDGTATDLLPGDILWKEGHTEIYAGDNMTYGAHWNWDGKNGDGDGTEVSYSNLAPVFTKYYRK